MTSDAKIGLLLGLIFIFVIAFVINGLPSLRPPISTVGASTTVQPQDETFQPDVAGRSGNLPSGPDSLEPPRTVETTPVAVDQPRSVEPQPSQAPPTATTPIAQSPSTPTAGKDSVRSILTLPPIQQLLDQLTPPAQEGRPAPDIALDTHAPVTEPPVPSVHTPVAAVPPSKTEPARESKPADGPTKVEARMPSLLASLPGSKTYTVAEGDNLASIAKKMYGPEEGNRVANIQRIYQANQIGMKSEHQLSIGQKLIIPPPLPKLSTPAPAPLTPEQVLPASLFEKPRTISEKVQSLSQRPAAITPAPTPAPTADARWYTVQDGDSLWKIANSQLGAGSRWDEIQKLNAELLANQTSLKLGTKLRLPSK